MLRRTFATRMLAGFALTPVLSVSTWPALIRAQATPTAGASPVAETANAVHVLHAGSLNQLVQQGLAPAAESEGLTVTDTGGNSVKVAISIKDGSMVGDLFMSAGADVNQTLIGADNGDWVEWFLVFASNEVVVAYSPRSSFAAQFDQAREGEIPWYEVLAEPGLRFGRDNPNLDPLGYYGVFISQLVDDYYQEPGLGARVFGDANNPDQVISPDFPQLENGELDAIFAYRTGAEDAGVPYITLPAEINLSHPDFDDQYASASYTTDAGTRFEGSTIRYTVAPLRGGNLESSLQFINFLISERGQQITEEAHFLPHPIWIGGNSAAAPESILSQTEGTYTFP